MSDTTAPKKHAQLARFLGDLPSFLGWMGTLHDQRYFCDETTKPQPQWLCTGQKILLVILLGSIIMRKNAQVAHRRSTVGEDHSLLCHTHGWRKHRALSIRVLKRLLMPLLRGGQAREIPTSAQGYREGRHKVTGDGARGEGPGRKQHPNKFGGDGHGLSPRFMGNNSWWGPNPRTSGIT